MAAKTGTSNFSDDALKKYKLPSYAVNDLWTVAYTSQYSVAVWYGYESAEIGYNINGGGHKEAVTSAVMKYIPKDTKGWTMPSSVVASQVEKETVPAKNAKPKAKYNIKKIEARISELEELLEAKRDLRFEPEYYHDHQKMQALDEEIDVIHNEIHHEMEKWELAMIEKEEMGL